MRSRGSCPVGRARGEDDRDAVRARSPIAWRPTWSPRRHASGRSSSGNGLAYASEVALREADSAVSLVEREDLAQAIADGPPERADEVGDAIALHHLNLSGLRLTDEQLLARELPGRVLKRAIITGVLLAVATAFLLVGVIVNLVPAVATMAVSASVRAPVTKGTVRTLAAVVLFPLAWWGTAAWLSDGFWTVLLEGLGFAACGLLLIWAWDAADTLWNDVQALRHRHDARAILDQVYSSREAVVRAVELAARRSPVP